MSPRHAARLAAISLALAATTGADATVILRGGVVEDAPIESLSTAGVRVGGLGQRTIGWDAVLRVEGEHADEAERFALLARDLFRARARLDRGDARLAAPVFERLHQRHALAGGPTGRAINEGQLRCKLAQGDHPAALEPWLLALEAMQNGARLAGGEMARTALDRRTALVPTLPPVFEGPPGWARRAAAATTRWTSNPAERSDGTPDPAQWSDLRILAETYRAAADHAAGRPATPNALLAAEPSNAGSPTARGARFARDIVLARIADADTRRTARQRLAVDARDHAGTWREAWARAAIGRSLAFENDPAARRRAAIELLHVPARFRRAQPYLAGVCLADAADILEQLGDTRAAQTLRDELRTAFPAHPAASRQPAATNDRTAKTNRPTGDRDG